jgi:adenylate cyclase
LRGFTRIAEAEPEQVVSLQNDYADVIVSTIQEHGGDVLKLIGDVTLAPKAAAKRSRRSAGRRTRGASGSRGVKRTPVGEKEARYRDVSLSPCR